VLTGLRYFRDEYEAHIAGTCPAGACKALSRYHITDDCIGCTICAQQCPVDAIPVRPFAKHTINDDLCTRCDACRIGCPEGAIEIRSGRGAADAVVVPAGGPGVMASRARRED
jgi:NADH-quinone oxidoreductase subunit F